jgi:hypothetical protein
MSAGSPTDKIARARHQNRRFGQLRFHAYQHSCRRCAAGMADEHQVLGLVLLPKLFNRRTNFRDVDLVPIITTTLVIAKNISDVLKI